ncbi:P-loop containing nucleoside triphosphate hydrolase protein, partial [Lobosporangium transversale]
SPEYSSSIYSQLTFAWINPLIYLGFKRPIQDIDLPNLEETDFSWFSIHQYKKIKLLRSVAWELFIQFLWALPWCFLVNASPYCMNKIIKYIECKTCGPPTTSEYSWVFGLLIASISESLTMQAALHKGRRLFVHIASICNAEVFSKALRRKDISSSATSDKSEGSGENKGKDKSESSLNISNLVAVDIRKLEYPFGYVFYIYGFPIQFIIAGFQLYNLLGNAALVGIVFMIISYPIPAKLYAMIMKIFKDIMDTKDERMDALNEMLSAIRIVKFFSWEAKFEEKIISAREKELKRTKDSYKKVILTDIVWMIMSLLNIVVVLTAYIKLFGNEITASAMFTTLALFNIMRTSLNTLPWTIKSMMQALVSLDRINKFLSEEELVRDITVTKLGPKAHITPSHPTIGFVNASYIWPSKENAQIENKKFEKKNWFQKRFKLKNLSVAFPVGQLSLVVGPTGSGKSALLLALLGELERLEGSMYLPRLDYNKDNEHGSGIAYVSQTAWLQNSTIRDNILFGKEFDQERYDAVIEGCALVTDVEILEAGDKTEIGEQGITLSGGQKQRVALARAIYSDASVLLLDDCLSAVDSHTGKYLFQTLTGPLLEGRTVIMATHQVQLTLSAASLVIVLNKGEIVGSGAPEEAVRNKWIDTVALAVPASDANSEISTLDGEDKGKDKKKGGKEKISIRLTEDEKKAEGAVAWKVYKIYFIASGGMIFWASLVLMFFARQFIDIGQNSWLANWANKMAETTGSFVIKDFVIALSVYTAFSPMDDNKKYGTLTMRLFGQGTPETINMDYYLGIYVLLSLTGIVFGAMIGYYVAMGGLTASRTLHQQLLRKITRAKVRFFDTTPIGRIINRFSSDMSTIDDEVSNNLQGLFSCFVTIVGIIFIISFNMPLFLVAGIFIIAIYLLIGIYYIGISRDLKRLNSNSKSPILNHFNETLTGLATIRAYGFEKRFLSTNLVNLDNNNRTFLLLWVTNRWLHWRVDIAGASVAFITGILVLQNWGQIEPGWAALSMTYSLMFTGTIVWVIRIYAMSEMNLNSVERVVEYMDLEEEPPAIIEGSRPPPSWPHAGEIVVSHLTMRYAPEAPDVLKDVSFTINAGEKVGVVGRTGSGKSTLAISLFRFMDPVKGTINIDGIDICKIGLHDLRSNLTIIPQDPILFKGTLRSNLDPFGEHEDRELWEALRRSHLIPESKPKNKLSVSSIKGSNTGGSETVDPFKITLDTPVKENGSNFSQGQRQMIALARALVRQSKVIVMDEATASVDFETDLKIQTTIRQEMVGATIITIAHRIRTIADFDRVLVMDAGELVEFDRPFTLMTREDSLFRAMCERSSEFDALIAIAKE